MVRIQLNLAPTASASSSSSAKRRRLDDGGANDASSSTAGIPRPLLALSPNGELILVELQGWLEMDDQGAEEGQSSTIGELIWGEGREVSDNGRRVLVLMDACMLTRSPFSCRTSLHWFYHIIASRASWQI